MKTKSKIKLTATRIAKLAPRKKPYEIRDEAQRGLLLRVQPSGSMSYIVEFARARRITLGKVDLFTPAQARDRAVEVLAEFAKGGDPREKRRAIRADDFATFINHSYAPWVETNRKAGRATTARLRASFGVFNKKKLTDITSLAFDKWRTSRLQAGIKPSTINRDLIALKSCLSKAVEWKVIKKNPIAAVKLSKVKHSSTVRYLSETEEPRLRAALDEREDRLRVKRASANEWRRTRNYELLPNLQFEPFVDHLKPMFLVSINTGIRRGEMFQLTWDNVDLERDTLTVTAPTSKTDSPRQVSLNSEALDALRNWKSQQSCESRLVFPSANGKPFDNINSAWDAVRKAAAIPNFRWHDLRHHFASKLVMAGVDLNTVRELLGHTDIKMTLRYADLTPKHKADAVAKLVSS